MIASGLPHTSVPMKIPSLSPVQKDIIWKMQHGRQLIKHPMHCGDPSTYWLAFPEQIHGEKADKRSINALVKRGFVEFAEREGRFPIYRLTALGRQVTQ